MLINCGNVSFLLGAFSLLVVAQQPERAAIREMNNDSVIKLIKAGLSDDLIITTITASQGMYDTSADGLIALKGAGASDRIVSEIVRRVSSASGAGVNGGTAVSLTPTAQPTQGPATAVAPEAAQTPFVPARERNSGAMVAAEVGSTPSKPRVFLQSASKGTNRNAARDQSMEMSKDLEKDCPAVRVTVNQSIADYTILLNHIEVGLARDNQIQVANKDGDLLAKTKEGGSIAGSMKKACALILADWAKR
jgi:hypothetical protein